MQREKLSRLKSEGFSLKDGAAEKVSVIVKVREPGYVPEALTVRSRVDPYLFTAEAHKEAVDLLEKNNSVVSYSINKTLPLID